MSSSKSFYIVLCLLCATLLARAEKPNDNRSTDSSQRVDNGYTREWGGKSLHQWKKDLIHSDPTYRVAAVLAILNFKQNADAVPEVVKRLYEDGDASVRIKAATFMRWVRPHNADRIRVIRGLAHALRDPQSVVRYEAAYSLQSFCPFNFNNKEECDALQDLVTCLQSTGITSSYEVREKCIDTLIQARVDPKTGPDLRVTNELIRHADPMYEAATRVRVKAIMALGAQGRPQDPKLLQRVMEILKRPVNFHSKNPSVRIWSHVAIIALEEKVNKKDLDTIAGYLKDSEAAVRAEAVMALGALENKAQDYVGKILDMLKEEKIPAVKANAALALGRMQNTGPNVLNALIRLTEEKERENILTVLSACTAFVTLGVNNAEVMRAMDKVLEHESLEKYQKDMVRKMIEELQNPRKKPVRNAVNNPEQGIAPAVGANKQKGNRR
jgi:HEAT repeat protein